MTTLLVGARGPLVMPLNLLDKGFGDATKIMIVGDSNTVGSNGAEIGFVGGWREGLYSRLRQFRSDFDFIGPNATPPELHTFGLWRHAATAGYKIEDITTNFAAYVASSGAPDLIVDCIGTNNIIAGDSLATMQTKRAALDAAYLAAAPNAKVIALAVPAFVAGTTVGANLAAWNAKQADFNAWLRDSQVVSLGSRARYLDASASLSAGDYQADGVHLNRNGGNGMAAAIAGYLDRPSLLGLRAGHTLPRSFRQRKYQASRKITTTGTDGYTITAHAGFNPGSGSFAYAFDYHPTAIDVANLRVMLQYGTYAASNFWGFWAKGRDVAWYFNSDGASNGGAIFDPGSGLALKTTGVALGTDGVALAQDTWHRIVLIGHAPSASVGIYINGRLVALRQSVAAWSFTQKTVYIGKGPEFGAMVGYYSRLHAYKGTSVPQPGSMAALLAVEGDYYDEESLCAGASANFNLDTTNADSINGNPAVTAIGGGEATAGAYPGGTTPIRPWEYAP